MSIKVEKINGKLIIKCSCGEEYIYNINKIVNKGIEYNSWKNMKSRCLNKNNKDYSDYGGRGIKICDEWIDNFDQFFKDLGKRPSLKHSLDRIDVNKNYCKENCRWATAIEQANNTRRNKIIKYKGKEKTLANWCRELNLHYPTIKSRIYNYKWSYEKAFNTKTKKEFTDIR